MAPGALTFVLHSHLPWVLHHGRWPHGSDWLCEAVVESYLPLWRRLDQRSRAAPAASGVTLGLSPVLCEQLAHPGFTGELLDYLDQKIAAAAADRAAFEREGEDRMADLARHWERFYRAALEDLLGPHGPRLVARFRALEERGAIEIITCAATHGYLPLLDAPAVERQVAVAVAAHRRHFGRAPRGIWLPECAYRPAGPWTPPAGPDTGQKPRRGLEEVLAAHGLACFFVDRHLIAGGRPLGAYGERFAAVRGLTGDAPAAAAVAAAARRPDRAYRVGGSAVACFGRDPASAIQVWSGESGYPGDGAYLDFHKKRFPGGHRYWAVTEARAGLDAKRPYVPEAAAARVPEHARHFIGLVRDVLGGASAGAPILCAMFDTELFGHWWFEGPDFVAAALAEAARSGIELTTASRHLERHPPREAVELPEGSWGDGGHHAVWLNDATRWTWERVLGAGRRFEALAGAARDRAPEPLLDRLLAQAGRELLLLEASDWQFLITTRAARDYAERRVAGHHGDFERLAGLAARRLEGGAIGQADEEFLAACEARDGLFADFAPRAAAAAGAAR